MDTATAIRRLQLHCAFQETDTLEVATLLTALLDQLGPVDRRAVVRHAYWRMPEVPTGALQTAAGGQAVLRELAGRGPVTGSCVRCSRVMRARTRDDVDVVPQPRCVDCRVGAGWDEDGDAAGDAAGDGAGDGAAVGAAVGAWRSRPVGTGFGWEFEARPVPWQPVPTDRAAKGVRRWAEHYPAAG